MNYSDKKIFWNTLLKMHDTQQSNLDELRDTVKLPRFLCRFRSVNEHTLMQLEENKLFFSSADYYDDPFDTYFYINYNAIIDVYNNLRNLMQEKNPTVINLLGFLSNLGAPKEEDLINILLNTEINFDILKKKIYSVREMIHKQLYSICFCDNLYNETLWLKYADNYGGFVQIYDFDDTNTIICGHEEHCKNCISNIEKPFIYPVYYSDDRYDATKYAIGLLLLDMAYKGEAKIPSQLLQMISNSLVWEAERVSLIKKSCHKYDQEWRMIRPSICSQRTCIRMKPSRVAIGLRMPEYKRRLVVSAAKVAGIKEIHEMFINDQDELDSRPLGQC